MPDEPSPVPESALPPAAPAFLVGAAKGGLAGLMLSVLPLVVTLMDRSRTGPFELALVGLGFVFAGAGVCGLDAASSRLDALWKRRTCRFLAGAVMPIGALAPQFGILSEPTWQGVDALKIVLVLGAWGVCLGLGVLAAGEPNTAPHRAQGCGRLISASLGAVMAGAVPLMFVAVLGGALEVFAGVLMTLLFALVVAGSFWLAQMLAAHMVRPLAVWLEPEQLLEEMRTCAFARGELLRAECALRAGRFDEALRALDSAEAHLSAETLDTGLIPLRRAEVFLALGRFDDAETRALVARDAPAILAEVARRRGDAEKAARLAQKWLEDLGTFNHALAWSVRGSALGIIALARADQGRIEEAGVALAAARNVHGIFPRSFDHLTVPRVADYIEACRERSHPA